MRTDPWYYINPLNSLSQVMGTIEQNDSYLSSIYVTVKVIGYIGCAISLIMAFVQFALSDSAAEASAAKQKIWKTIAVAFIITIFAWVTGIVMGIVMLL